MRALIVIRLSRFTEESTSVGRQREACDALCRARGFDVVGVAEDVDVSAGKTTPFTRPELGEWLKSPEKFDLLVVWKADRLVRSARDLLNFLDWARTHQVGLVSVQEPYIDTNGKMTQALLTMTAMFAEMELDSIRERTYSSWHHRSEQGLSTGSLPLYGYKIIRDGAEAKLEVDPEPAEIVQEVCRRVLAGDTYAAICDDLNERGTLTPRDFNHVRQGRSPKGARWSESSLIRLLENPGLQGVVTYRERLLDRLGQPRKSKTGDYVYGPVKTRVGADGAPVQRAEPVLSRAEWRRLQAEIQRRRGSQSKRNKKSDSLLLQVAFCGACGLPMYRLRQKDGPDRYRCASSADPRKQTCANGSVLVEDADELIEKLVLGTVGSAYRLERTWEPGEDIAGQIEEVSATLADLTDQLGKPLFKPGTPHRAQLEQNIQKNADRLEELQAAGPSEGGWKYEPTNDLFSDWWAGLTVVEKNLFLRDAEVRAVMTRPKGKSAPAPSWDIELGNVDRMVAGYEPAEGSTAWLSREVSKWDVPKDAEHTFYELLPGVEVHWGNPEGVPKAVEDPEFLEIFEDLGD